jgi:hypothetical protein
MFFVGPVTWRGAFLLGLAPALLVLWIRLSIREPEKWDAARRAHSLQSAPALGDLRELVRGGPWRARAIMGLALGTVGLATFWGIFAWSPELVGLILGERAEPALRQALGSRAYLVMNFTGGLLGLLAFAPLASWLGRRPAFAFYHLGAAIATPAVFLGATTYAQALWLLPVMAFFVLGMHSGYAIYFPELFPTRLRATGSSMCFNSARVLGAAILIVRGTLGSALGLRWAVVAMSGLFWVGLVILIFAPETVGRELPE